MKKIFTAIYNKCFSRIGFPLFLICSLFCILIFWTCRSFVSVMTDYLYDDNIYHQSIVSEAVESNISTKLEEYIEIGAQISIDTSLYEAIDNYYYILDSREKYENELMQAILVLWKYSSEINAILICSEEEILMQYEETKKVDIGDGEIEDGSYLDMIIQEAAENIPKCQLSLSDVITGEMSLDIIYPVKNTNNYIDTEFYIIINYDMGKVLDMLAQLDKYDYISCCITDTKVDSVLYTELSELKIQDEDNQLIIEDALYATDFVFVSYLNESILQEEIGDIYGYMSMLLIVIFTVLLLMLFVLIRYILEPVSQIHTFAMEVKQGNLNQELEIQGNHELWVLAEEFNEMLSSIKKRNLEEKAYNKKMLEYMEMKQVAEQNALESQINAHFICNTLNVINYEAIEVGNHKISILLRRLSNMLRYSFEWKDSVCLEHELNWVGDYLYLQKERLGDVFDYEFDIDSSCLNTPCTKLMLQPFVENSIIHGFKGIESDGKIEVKVFKQEDEIIIEIVDNGLGIEEATANQIRLYFTDTNLYPNKRDEKKGIGIANVYARLRIFYGERFRLELRTEEQNKTKFLFHIPGGEAQE